MSHGPFRHIKFDDKRIEQSAQIEAQATQLHHVLLTLPEGRERSVAITKLEESVMWANKAIRNRQIQDERDGVR